MKPAAEWDLEYIKHLPVGEFDWVEFKSRRGLDFSIANVKENQILDELAKQLSAFANSGGGVVVYGIANPATTYAVDDGGILFTCKTPNIREWLEDVIPNLVEFPLRKFNVYAIQTPELASERRIILVEIPDSHDVPHQSRRDKCYYARVGGKTRPVGHTHVADMFNRERHARFEVWFSLSAEIKTYVPFVQIGPNREEKKVREVKLSIVAANRGKRMAQYLRTTVRVPACIVHPDLRDPENMDSIGGVDYYRKEFSNTRRDVMKRDPSFGVTQWGPSWFDPVLPGLTHTWEIECDGDLVKDRIPPDLKVRWEVYCDNAPVILGETPLRDITFLPT